MISDDGQSIIYEIYSRHYKKMLYTAAQILGKEGGEDAVHDVFVKLIEKFTNKVEYLGDKPGQYFVIIVRNHSLNVLRQNKSISIPLDEELLSETESLPTASSSEDALLDDVAVEILAAHIRRLPPSMRQILELRFIEGYSNIEIAEMLGISQSAVSTSINKARNRLKELLEGGANNYDSY
jgi:RNA polymerase sigma-70 factor (ECF subfamily)